MGAAREVVRVGGAGVVYSPLERVGGGATPTGPVVAGPAPVRVGSRAGAADGGDHARDLRDAVGWARAQFRRGYCGGKKINLAADERGLRRSELISGNLRLLLRDAV